MIYFVNFQHNNLDKVNDVNDVLDKCVKNDNLDTVDSNCKSVTSLLTKIVTLKSTDINNLQAKDRSIATQMVMTNLKITCSNLAHRA